MTDKPTPWGSVTAQFAPDDTPEFKALVRRKYLQYLTTKPFDPKDVEEQKDYLRQSRMDQIRSQIAANPDLRMTMKQRPADQGGAYEAAEGTRNRLFDAWRGGVGTSIPGAVANRLSGGGAEDFEPEGVWEGLTYGGGALIGAIPEFAATMAVLPAAPATIPALVASKAPTVGRVAAALGRVGQAAHATRAGRAVLSNPISRMATVGGVHGAVNEATAGSLNRGAVDPLEILRRGGVGAATMGAGKAANVGARMLAGGKAVRALPIPEIAESLSKVGGGSRLAGNLAEIGTMGIGGHVIDAASQGRAEWPTWEQSLVAAGPMLAPMAIGAAGRRGAMRAMRAATNAPPEVEPIRGQDTVQTGEVWPLINPEKGLSPRQTAETLALRRHEVASQLDRLPTSAAELARLQPQDQARVTAQANALQDRLTLLDQALVRVNARGEQNADWRQRRNVAKAESLDRMVDSQPVPGSPTMRRPPPRIPGTVDPIAARKGSLATATAERSRNDAMIAALTGNRPPETPSVEVPDPGFGFNPMATPPWGVGPAAPPIRPHPGRPIFQSRTGGPAPRGDVTLSAETLAKIQAYAKATNTEPSRAVVLLGRQDDATLVDMGFTPPEVNGIRSLVDVAETHRPTSGVAEPAAAPAQGGTAFLEEGGPLSMMGGGDASVKGQAPRPFDPTMAAPGSGGGIGSMAGTPAELHPAAPKGGVVVPPGAAPARPEIERAITTPYKVDPKTGREHYAFINWQKQNMPAEYHDRIVPVLAQAIQESGRYPKQRKSVGEHLAEEGGVSPKMIDELFVEPHKTVDAAVLGAMKTLTNQMSGDYIAAIKRLELEGPRMTAPEREALGAKADQLKHAITSNFDFISKTRTEYGRNLYFQRLVAGQTWDVDYWLGKARRASGGALRDQDMLAVQKIAADGRAFEAEATRLDAEGDVTGAARARQGADQTRMRMAKEQARLDRQTPWSIVTGLWRAGLLSGPKTHARNIIGNTAFQLAEEAARVPAVMADMLMERTGMGAGRTVAAPSGAAMQRSLREAIGGWDESGRWQSSEALRSLGRAIRDGEVPQGFAKGLELTEPGQLKFSSEALFGTRVAPVLDRYVNTVFGALKAEDRIFNAYALRRSLEEQARVQGLNMKLGGEELEAHVQRAAANPTAEMQAKAAEYALFATFNNENMLSTEITKARQGLRSHGNLGRAAAMGTEFIMPFNKTPTNIVSRLLDYAVVGNVAKGLASERVGKAFTALHRGEAGKRWQEFRAEAMKKLSPQEQKAIADAVGRGTIGVATIGLGYFLASRGEMTGTYQGQAGDRGREQLLDRPASAIKLGGQWNVIGSMSPVGNLMALGATIYRDQTKLQGLGLAIPIMAVKTALDQPFLQGVEGVVDLVNSENFGQGASKGAGKFVQSWVPRIAQDVTDIEEGIRSGGVVPRREAMGPMQGLQAAVPGWRESLPAKIDPFGQPVQGSVWGAVNPMLSRPAREDVDPIANEISRLDDVLRQATGKGLGISPPAKRRNTEEIPPDVYRATARTAGDRARRDLLRVIRSGAYRRLRNDPEGQADMIRDIVKDAREAAKK